MIDGFGSATLWKLGAVYDCQMAYLCSGTIWQPFVRSRRREVVNHGKVGGNKQKQKKKKEEIEALLYLTHYSAQYSVLAHQSTMDWNFMY